MIDLLSLSIDQAVEITQREFAAGEISRAEVSERARQLEEAALRAEAMAIAIEREPWGISSIAVTLNNLREKLAEAEALPADFPTRRLAIIAYSDQVAEHERMLKGWVKQYLPLAKRRRTMAEKAKRLH